jgi:RNA polymerase sigma-70 factor (sigma-E family)
MTAVVAAGPAPTTSGGFGVVEVDQAAGWDADRAVTELYSAHYRPLVRLAALLLHDPAEAEEVTQDAFVALHRRWRRLRDPGAALPYLRASVVNGARSRLRHRAVVQRHLQAVPTHEPSAEQQVLAGLDRRAVVEALRALPARQREALVLRYWAGLSEAEIAEAMGVARGSVKSHASRGMTALRTTLERRP